MERYPHFGMRCMGTRLLPGLSKSTQRIHRGMVELDQLVRGRAETTYGYKRPGAFTILKHINIYNYE